MNECQVESKEDIELNNKYLQLLQKEKELNSEIDDLERNYQSKVSDLLILTKIHCQTKADIQNLFDELGLSHDDKEKIEKYKNEYFIQANENTKKIEELNHNKKTVN